MSKYVNVAAILFATQAQRGAPDAREIVLAETRQALDAQAGYGLDLLVLSEGVEAYGQTTDQAEELERPGPFLQLYSEFARRERLCVAGSVKLREAGRAHNSLAVFGPDGRVLGRYHKTFLTDGEREAGLTPGAGPVAIDTPVGRLGCAICFDLNFAALRQGYARLKPQLIAFASMYHGGLAQAMWAYECRAYLISALPFIGGGIIDPFGRPVKLSDEYTPHPRARLNLDYVMAHLDFNRAKFPDILKKYGPEVEIDIPPHVAPALIFSHSEQRSAQDIVREYELELLDDYLTRSLAANAARRGHELDL